MRARRWFGTLLDWKWNPEQEMNGAWHGGRMHWIGKVDRRTADAHGGGMSRGWHLWFDNRDPEATGWADGWGPGLGRSVAWAKLMAEAWILCPYEDMMCYPQLRNAIVGSIGFNEDNFHLVGADHAQRLFVVRRRTDTIGYVVPVFTGPAGVVAVGWQILDGQAQELAVAATWREAMTVLRRLFVTAPV